MVKKRQAHTLLSRILITYVIYFFNYVYFILKLCSIYVCEYCRLLKQSALTLRKERGPMEQRAGSAPSGRSGYYMQGKEEERGSSLQLFFSPWKKFWRSSVRFSTRREPDQQNRETRRGDTGDPFFHLFVVVSSHERRGKKGARACLPLSRALCSFPDSRVLTPSEAMRCDWAMPCGNGQTLLSKRKHGACVPRFSFFSGVLVALCCLEAWGSGPPGDGGGSCSPCPVNCSCAPAGPQPQSCVVNCSNIGLERAPAAAAIPRATTVLWVQWRARWLQIMEEFKTHSYEDENKPQWATFTYVNVTTFPLYMCVIIFGHIHIFDLWFAMCWPI